MTKRQKRYNTAALIKENITNLLGKKVNIVLSNGNVIFVKLHEQNGDTLKVSNMRLNKENINLSDISEIILDFNG